MAVTSVWDDKGLVRRLAELWLEGHSTAQIALKLGVTKNSVISRARRDCLPYRKPCVASTVQIRRKAVVTRKVTMARKLVVEPKPVQVVPPEPVSLGLTLMERGVGQCCWPTHEGPIRFCGHPVDPGSVNGWCEHHRWRGTRPRDPRRERQFLRSVLIKS